MPRSIFVVVCAVAFVLGFVVYRIYQRSALPERIAEVSTPSGPVLLAGMGRHRHPVTTRNPEAQKWFDQGLVLTFGFNHDAAERSYLKAATLDPECAMCWWGAALVLGPHINSAMDPANAGAAWERLQKARQHAPAASAREQAYIEALSRRYVEEPPADRTALDQSYAAAMRELVRKHPDDLDARTLYAEALMNLHPWDLYDGEGRPRPWTAQIVTTLEGVLAKNSEHPGASHFYIHAVEASNTPERALPYADRLLSLVPGAGHLVHMPAHIYIRTGRYQQAAEANRRAIAADDIYLAQCNPGGLYPLGYVPHNHHFLWYSSSWQGNRKQALASAAETRKRADTDLMRQPGLEGIQHYWVTPLYARVRFGLWDELLKEPPPPADLRYPVAVWHYARGVASVRRGNTDAARQHLAELARIAADPAMATVGTFEINSFAAILRVAERVLAGELAAARGDLGRAERLLREAVSAEDGLRYNEPQDWHLPARQSLGAMLLGAGRPTQAEAAFRADLKRNRDNGWALYGLALALRVQHREKEAAEVERKFAAAWAHADVQLASSQF